MSPDPVHLDVTDGIARITLADPDRRNALSRALSDRLADAVGDALAADARVIVLAAQPPVFCSGGSLDALIEGRDPLSAAYAGHDALAAAPVPTIAAVAGAAVGAGVNLPGFTEGVEKIRASLRAGR